MSRGIINKIVLCGAGVLVLVQLLFYNVVRVGNADRLEDEGLRLTQELEELSVIKDESQQYLAKLQKEYDKIAATVPPKILEGYEDHEVLLASFLDYLKAPELEKVDGKVIMQGARKDAQKSVPFSEHDLSITFSFTDLPDARKLLSYILDQDYYPLAVRNFELRNSGQDKISGTMQLSLLIPVMQAKPIFGMKEEGR